MWGELQLGLHQGRSTKEQCGRETSEKERVEKASHAQQPQPIHCLFAQWE